MRRRDLDQVRGNRGGNEPTGKQRKREAPMNTRSPDPDEKAETGRAADGELGSINGPNDFAWLQAPAAQQRRSRTGPQPPPPEASTNPATRPSGAKNQLLSRLFSCGRMPTTNRTMM